MAEFRLDHPGVSDLVTADTLVSEFFARGEPSPASPRGHGQRVNVCIGWAWWPAKIAPEAGAKLVVSRIERIPGVEAVSEPAMDIHLGLTWMSTLAMLWNTVQGS